MHSQGSICSSLHVFSNTIFHTFSTVGNVLATKQKKRLHVLFSLKVWYILKNVNAWHKTFYTFLTWLKFWKQTFSFTLRVFLDSNIATFTQVIKCSSRLSLTTEGCLVQGSWRSQWSGHSELSLCVFTKRKTKLILPHKWWNASLRSLT